MCQDKTKNFRILEVLITSINQRDFPLPLDETLRDCKRITAVEAWKNANVANSPFSGAATVNDTVFNKSFLSLQTKEGIESLVNIPLIDLAKASNNGVLYQVDAAPLNVTKCRITVPEGTSLSASEVFLIGFHYEI